MSSSRRTGTGVALSLLLVLGLGYVGVHLNSVHDQSWEYRWSPSATPPLVRFDGRSYLRGSVHQGRTPGLVRLGRTAGGASIYGPAGPHPHVPTGIEVVDAGRTTGYSLSGGP